jgi:nondiscriminating glutamyl-tRNA synthetase
VVRFRIPEIRTIAFDDIVRGHVEIDTTPSAATWSSCARTARRCTTSPWPWTTRPWRSRHVIRGEDHLSNTPKHILLFEALGSAYPLSLTCRSSSTRIGPR